MKKGKQWAFLLTAYVLSLRSAPMTQMRNLPPFLTKAEKLLYGAYDHVHRDYLDGGGMSAGLAGAIHGVGFGGGEVVAIFQGSFNELAEKLQFEGN